MESSCHNYIPSQTTIIKHNIILMYPNKLNFKKDVGNLKVLVRVASFRFTGLMIF